MGKAATMSLWRCGRPLSSSQMVPRHQQGGCATYRPLCRSPQGTAMTAMGRRQSVRPAGAKGGRGVNTEGGRAVGQCPRQGSHLFQTCIIFHPLAFPPSFQDWGSLGGGWDDREKLWTRPGKLRLCSSTEKGCLSREKMPAAMGYTSLHSQTSPREGRSGRAPGDTGAAQSASSTVTHTARPVPAECPQTPRLLPAASRSHQHLLLGAPKPRPEGEAIRLLSPMTSMACGRIPGTQSGGVVMREEVGSWLGREGGPTR